MSPVFGIFIRGRKLEIPQPIDDVVSVSSTDVVIFDSSLLALTPRFGRVLWLFSVTLLVSSILSGCASLVMSSTATSVQFSPTFIDFGDVDVDTAVASVVSLSNQGTASTNIAGLAVSGMGFALHDNVIFPLAIGAKSSREVSVDFAPPSEGDFTGELSAVDSLNRPLASVRVRGHGRRKVSHRLTVTPTTLDFGNLSLNSSATQPIILASTGTGSVTIDSPVLSDASFTVSGVSFPLTLQANQSEVLNVTFKLTAAAVISGGLSIKSNSEDSSAATVHLTGTGVVTPGVSTFVPQLTVSATSLSFGDVTVNSKATKAITLTSTGTGPVTVNGADVAGTGYALAGGSFPVSLNPGTSLTFQVGFDPKTTGASAGTLNISSNASATTTVGLSGTGVSTSVPQLTVSVASLSFGEVTLNSTVTKAITLTSTGTGPLIVNGAGVAGNGYALAGSRLPVSLNPGASLTLQVGFDPETTGAMAGILTVSSNASATTTVSLSGAGISTSLPQQLTVSATSLSFGNVTVNSTATKTITLASTGTGAVSLTGVSVSGSGFSAAAIVAPLKLNPGQTLNLQITFTPTAIGAATGSLNITSDSSRNSTTKVSLSGTGASALNAALTVSATTLDFGSIAVGLPVAQMLTLTSTGNAPVTVSKVSVTGSGFTISGLTFPVTLNPTIAVKLTVLFTPVAAGTSTGQLSIASNSSSGTSLLVSLNGSATTQQHSVSLTWSSPAKSPAPVSSYKIHRAAANSSFMVLNGSVIGQTRYVDQSVQSGTTYTYYVTSVDASDTESAPSNEISLTVP